MKRSRQSKQEGGKRWSEASPDLNPFHCTTQTEQRSPIPLHEGLVRMRQRLEWKGNWRGFANDNSAVQERSGNGSKRRNPEQGTSQSYPLKRVVSR